MSQARITIRYSAGGLEQRTLADGTYLVGRDAGQIVLADPDVSASHLRIDVRQGEVFVTDLGSTNGTYGPDNQRIHPGQRLALGDSIRLGSSAITVLAAATQAGGTRAMAQVPAALFAAPAPAPAANMVQRPSGPSPQIVTATAAPPAELRVRGKRVVTQSGQSIKVSVSAYSATHVSGGGSSTSYGPGGYAQTTHHAVTSSVTHHTLQEIWLRTAAGRDRRFQLRDSNVDVLEGHNITLLIAEQTEQVLRLINHSTGYYYRINVFASGAAKVIWDRIWPFVIGGFMAMPCFNLLFALGAMIEAFGKRGWACSSSLLKLCALGALVTLLLGWLAAFDVATRAENAGTHHPTDVLLSSPAVLFTAVLSYACAVGYYQLRSWNTQRMAQALDAHAGKLL